MSIIGTLTTVQNSGQEELHGDIRTLNLAVKVRLVPEQLKSSDLAPDYKIYAQDSSGELTDIGAAWKKTKQKIGDIDFEFLSITIDDPSFTHPLNVAAFKNNTGGWDVTWRRRQDKQQPAA